MGNRGYKIMSFADNSNVSSPSRAQGPNGIPQSRPVEVGCDLTLASSSKQVVVGELRILRHS